jgi:hypothetical protein
MQRNNLSYVCQYPHSNIARASIIQLTCCLNEAPGNAGSMGIYLHSLWQCLVFNSGQTTDWLRPLQKFILGPRSCSRLAKRTENTQTAKPKDISHT